MTSKESILVVDPVKNLLYIYRIFLEEERYRVETSSNLKEASQKLLTEHYGVLITEFSPPWEETFCMLQQVKEHSPETYILIVTDATLDEKMYERLFNTGVDDLILKPYSPAKILAHVKKGFRNRELLIKKHELEGASLTDPITQKIEEPIFNLPHFQRCLRQELKRAKRHHHCLSLLLMEAPGQTKAEKPYEGFFVELMRLLRKNTRDEDIVGRGNGGFGILLPETDENGSRALVKRLLQLIKASPSLQTDDRVKLLGEAISFQIFVYPEKFSIPEPLKAILSDIPGLYPPS